MIDTHILLDTKTIRLRNVSVVEGGKLVFSPLVDLAKITAGSIDIGAGGEVHIGSADCQFDGAAEIVLTGTFHKFISNSD